MFYITVIHRRWFTFFAIKSLELIYALYMLVDVSGFFVKCMWFSFCNWLHAFFQLAIGVLTNGLRFISSTAGEVYTLALDGISGSWFCMYKNYDFIFSLTIARWSLLLPCLSMPTLSTLGIMNCGWWEIGILWLHQSLLLFLYNLLTNR